ncbi:MerR family transcriptional regulator [Streptomyces sp. NPDC059262]|uniref:MerR family transcriptional regulator n=1 Tax=Streptomyces sp. NPDC059262 TaxID=3346797 RepID=UPI003692E7B9
MRGRSSATLRAVNALETRRRRRVWVRTATGQRVYAERDIARIRAIRRLLGLGPTVEDVRTCSDRIDLLIAHPDRRCRRRPRCHRHTTIRAMSSWAPPATPRWASRASARRSGLRRT